MTTAVPRVIPPHTALSALPAVALDLETTGLDPKRDRIVQAAAVAMLGSRIEEAPRIDQLVNPQLPIPPAATRIHGLGDADVAAAPAFADIAPALRAALSERVVVGYHIAFDLAVLQHEAARAGVPWNSPPGLDIALLMGALHPDLRTPTLETTAKFLGVTIERRHTAWGDAMAAADAFARLIPRLRDAGVRTLGEAQMLAAKRIDLIERQAQAGWRVASLELAASAAQPQPRIDSYVFERHLGDVMNAPPVSIAPDATLRDAARMMTERHIGALLVTAPGARPVGIVTERDLVRAATDPALSLDKATVGEFMTTAIETMAAGELLYRALARMDRRGIRHLCVVDAAGGAVGMVSQRDLLRHRARSALAIEDAIASADSVTALAAAYGRLPDAAARLIAEDVDGSNVARVISSELRALTAQAAHLAETRLQAVRGDAPAPWCLLVLGSGGRGESMLSADQDNALIHAGTADDDGWFADFGAVISEMLDEAGVPKCRGGVMAANPPWRGNAAAWRERTQAWLRHARPEDLLQVDIFFDMAPVAGDTALAEALQRESVQAASHAPAFIGLLADSAAGLRPPVGLFGRLQTQAGRVDLKIGGLLPIVSIARTLALRIGSTARSTPDRLRDAVAAGRLAEADMRVLLETHAELMTLILRQQIEDLAAGIRPSTRVAVKGLGRDRTRGLARNLGRVDDVLRLLRASVSG